MTKNEVIEKEQATWLDVVKKINFLTELVCAKTDKGMIKTASVAMNDAISKHSQLQKQRLLLEFGE